MTVLYISLVKVQKNPIQLPFVSDKIFINNQYTE